MIKQVQEKTEHYIQFTPEEIKSFGWEEGEELSITEEDGNIIIQKLAPIDIDLSEFSREELEALITESCDREMNMNELIIEILVEAVEKVIDE